MLLCVCICKDVFKLYNTVRLFCRQHLGIQSWMMSMTKRWRHIDFAALLGLHRYTEQINSYFLHRFDEKFCGTLRITKSLTYTQCLFTGFICWS